ncbi:hypothetical protein ThvES_00008890 [Thiovulum sp. ES]|nr:hypothetical protein ThvES_00008890 [Thiovulum sp. ES]
MEQDSSIFKDQYFWDSTKRKYYVAVTRAKKSLTIVSNVHNSLFLQGNFFEENEIENISPKCPEPTKIILFTGLNDINLGNAWKFQNTILNNKIFAGTKLELGGNYGSSLISKGKEIGNISRKFQTEIKKYTNYKIDIEIDSQVFHFLKMNEKHKNTKEGTWIQTLCRFEFS